MALLIALFIEGAPVDSSAHLSSAVMTMALTFSLHR